MYKLGLFELWQDIVLSPNQATPATQIFDLLHETSITKQSNNLLLAHTNHERFLFVFSVINHWSAIISLNFIQEDFQILKKKTHKLLNQIVHYVTIMSPLRSIATDDLFIGKIGSYSRSLLTCCVWDDCGANLTKGRTQSAVNCFSYEFKYLKCWNST